MFGVLVDRTGVRGYYVVDANGHQRDYKGTEVLIIGRLIIFRL